MKGASGLSLRRSMSLRRLLLAVVGLFVVLAVGVLAALGPVVRSVAAKRAAAYGVTIEVGSVRPRWLGVRLRDVRVAQAEGGLLEARVEEVLADVSAGGGIDAIRLNGGEVVLRGEARDVLEWVRARRGNPTGSGVSQGSGERAISVSGIGVRWSGIAGQDTSLAMDGVRVERAAGEVKVELGAMAFSAPFSAAKAERVSLAAVKDERGALRVRDVRLGRVEVDVGMPTAAASGAKAAAGAPEGDSASEAVGAWSGRIGRLRKRAIEGAGALAGALSSAGQIESSQVFVRIRYGGEQVQVGPGRFRVQREAAAIVVEASAGGEGGRSPLELRGTVPLEDGEIGLKIQGGPVSLASLGVREGELGLVGVAGALLEARADVSLSSGGELLSFDARGQVASLGIHDGRLAEEAIAGLDVGWRARGDLRTDGSVVRMQEGELRLGEIRFLFEGQLDRGTDFTRARGSWEMPSTVCQAMLGSLPRALIPRVADMQLGGTFALTGRVAFDTRDLEALELDWKVREACRITGVPEAQSVARFRGPFRRFAYDGQGNRIEALSGPGTRYWTSFEELSPYLEASVLTTEDGRFHRHSGFDKEAIKSAIKDNLRAGRFVRGASTISMQLAKNLYLDRNKTLSRKLEEVLLTAYLEQALSKAEILELYFNIVELGPSIYGVGQAAEHYFDTTPAELSLGQALYLISTLPNPKKQYFDADGRVSERWTKYLHRLMRIMVARQRITERELLEGMSEIVTLGMPVSPRREDILVEAPGDDPEPAQSSPPPEDAP